MTYKIRHSGEFDIDQGLSFLRDNHLGYSHPDWLSQKDRLNGPFTYILEDEGEICAILCSAREDPTVGWIRFFNCLHDGKHDDYFNRLFSESIVEHRREGTQALFCVGSKDWMTNLLQKADFELNTHVVTLAKIVDPITTIDQSLFIREMMTSDLETVLALDQLAFSPEWRFDQLSLQNAYTYCSIARVGLRSNVVVSYSLTNAIFGTGHLNRLAVHPTLWGHKLGVEMLEDLNSCCLERGITQLTVNTQENNQRSIALYQRCNFKLSGESIPIFRLRISE